MLGNLITTNFEATNAEIEDIKAKYITAEKVKTDYMEVKNWTSAGKIKTNKIDVNELVGYFADIQNIQLGTVWINGLNLGADGGGYFMYDGNPVSWKHFTLPNGETIYYLG